MKINLAKDLERTYTDFNQKVSVTPPQGQPVEALGFISEESEDFYSEGDSFRYDKVLIMFHSPTRYSVGSTVTEGNNTYRITGVGVNEGAYTHTLKVKK